MLRGARQALGTARACMCLIEAACLDKEGPHACVLSDSLLNSNRAAHLCGVALASEQAPAGDVGQLAPGVADDDQWLLACGRHWDHRLDDDVGWGLSITHGSADLCACGLRRRGAAERNGRWWSVEGQDASRWCCCCWCWCRGTHPCAIPACSCAHATLQSAEEGVAGRCLRGCAGCAEQQHGNRHAAAPHRSSTVCHF